MANKPNKAAQTKDISVTGEPDIMALVTDLRQMIDEARATVALTVNRGLTFLYWRVGQRINAEILKGNRAKYGQKILATVSQQLTDYYGQGFSYSALTRMAKFAEVFTDKDILATLSQTLRLSQILELLSMEKTLQRE